MTNAEIIMGSMVLAELDPMTTVVNTFAGWKRRGYSVKKGEKAVFKTKIWKPVKYAKKEQESEIDANLSAEDSDNKHLVLVNAAFFTAEQVEKREATA